MPRRNSRGAGFTLIEILVALALSGLVLVSAHALLVGVADRGHALAVRTDSLEWSATGALTLRRLVGQLEVGTPPSGPFAGGPVQASFTSWCDSPSGWQERCAITLGFDTVDGELSLVTRVNDGTPRALVQGFREGSFRYLKSAAEGGQWFESWGTGITAPVALGVILDRDTLLVRIGERG